MQGVAQGWGTIDTRAIDGTEQNILGKCTATIIYRERICDVSIVDVLRLR